LSLASHLDCRAASTTARIARAGLSNKASAPLAKDGDVPPDGAKAIRGAADDPLLSEQAHIIAREHE
jgi:hypothetical protein